MNVLATNEIAGQYVHQQLKAQDLLNDSNEPKKHRFYVSDYTASFEQTTRLVYGSDVSLEQLNFW